MPLAESDRELIVDELGREPTRTEAVLFENLWSEHCAYRSSWPLLSAFESEGDQVVVGPGDDAGVVAVPTPDGADADDAGGEDTAEYTDTYVALAIESHNHPSYVDPYDGAATGVGGIVRDVMSMGAYPIALADSLYFGPFDREHSRYLFEGVVEGIADYGNAIGVPTVAGSVEFHPGYEGNPLVNVACVGLVEEERLVTAAAKEPGNCLVLVGNATGRDGLGGASFASEDLDEDSETEDRPAVQVGDPYAEKRLIEANEALLDRDLVAAARDLGAAGLGGATSEMAALGDRGADIDLDAVHQREPNMSALEILLAESQERMCYEVRPGDVPAVRAVADRFDLGCSVVGRVTDTGRYVATFGGTEARRASEGSGGVPASEASGGSSELRSDGERSEPRGRETVVDVPADFLADGAPTNDLDRAEPDEPTRDLPDADPAAAFDAVVASPDAASRRWVYRQYDHEVGVRTAVRPGEADAAVLALRETARDVGADGARDPAAATGVGLALSAGAAPHWTDAAPYDGARAVAVENATNLAATGAAPLAAVDCLNGGNPETPEVYGGFAAVVDGLAEGCAALDVPVVGGNVSLYNDSPSGPVPPTPTLSMVGTRPGYDAPGVALSGEGDLLVVGDPVLDGEPARLGGSAFLASEGGSDRFPAPPEEPRALVEALAAVAREGSTLAVHDVSTGGLAATLAEMVTPAAGAEVTLPGEAPPAGRLYHERAGRAVVETTAPDAVRERFDGVAPVHAVGTATGDGVLSLRAGDAAVERDAAAVADLRATLAEALD